MKRKLCIALLFVLGLTGCQSTTVIGGRDEPTDIVITDKEYENMIVRVNDIVYKNTGDVHMTRETILVDGVIESEVKEDEVPVENNQSNFGIGYNYHIEDEKTILVEIDSAWYIFKNEN